jgi:hypothetical protein
MAAKCTVIAVDHPESAANEMIADAGSLVASTVDALTETVSWKSVTPNRCSDI